MWWGGGIKDGCDQDNGRVKLVNHLMRRDDRAATQSYGSIYMSRPSRHARYLIPCSIPAVAADPGGLRPAGARGREAENRRRGVETDPITTPTPLLN